MADSGQKPAEPGRETRRGPELRAEALRLLTENYTLSAVARMLGVNRNTVREWRDSPEGQRSLEQARTARAEQYQNAAEQARQVIRENVARAAQTLADNLDAPNRRDRATAARELLDRGGVPRTERVEGGAGRSADLSRLTDEQLVQLARLQQLAMGDGSESK